MAVVSNYLKFILKGTVRHGFEDVLLNEEGLKFCYHLCLFTSSLLVEAKLASREMRANVQEFMSRLSLIETTLLQQGRAQGPQVQKAYPEQHFSNCCCPRHKILRQQ